MYEALVEQAIKLIPIFQPRSFSEIERGRKGLIRLAYYTSADTALNIIRNRTVWMRDARCMNDYSEVVLGYQRVIESAGPFIAALDGIRPGLSESVMQTVRALQTHLQEVYICCLSEHLDTENPYGRLSMWRAYGGGAAGVALVLRLPFDQNIPRAVALRLPAAPVAYFDRADFSAHMESLAENVRGHRSELIAYDQQVLHVAAASALLMLAIASKHPGFKEEREWRLAHIPSLGASKVLRCELETIGGIPQRVQKIPLKNFPELGVSGLDIIELFDSVIIGPCAYPRPIAGAFLDALTAAKIPDPAKRIVLSDIPLRT